MPLRRGAERPHRDRDAPAHGRILIKAPATLARLQQWEIACFARASADRRPLVIGPFRALPGSVGQERGFDYVLPLGHLDDDADGAVARLISRYRTDGFALRIEFNEDAWPGLARRLERAGLRSESRNPLMVCAPAERESVSAADAELRFEPHQQDGRLGWRGQALVDGALAGLASLSGYGGIGELYGVVTDPRFRRRGIASSLCSGLMARYAVANGDLVFLEAEGGAAQSLYRRLGFAVLTHRLSYIPA